MRQQFRVQRVFVCAQQSHLLNFGIPVPNYNTFAHTRCGTDLFLIGNEIQSCRSDFCFCQANWHSQVEVIYNLDSLRRVVHTAHHHRRRHFIPYQFSTIRKCKRSKQSQTKWKLNEYKKWIHINLFEFCIAYINFFIKSGFLLPGFC